MKWDHKIVGIYKYIIYILSWIQVPYCDFYPAVKKLWTLINLTKSYHASIIMERDPFYCLS